MLEKLFGRRKERADKRVRQFILWFDELTIADVGLVGGKNASLGEMYQTLTKKGMRIPNGFAITAHAYRYLLEKTGIEREMRKVLQGLNVKNVRDLSERGRQVRQLIRHAEFPEELRTMIVDAYVKLSKKYGKKAVDVAVRSSATAEDLPEASFAGQQETFLNIHSEHDLIDACKDCFASLFTNRAISYRVEKGFDHFDVALSIGVQKMVRSDMACSGVMFTLDTETGFRDAVFVTGSWGLGENIVQGAVNPDEYYVFKPTLRQGFESLISKTLGSKEKTMIYSIEGSKPVKNIDTPKEKQEVFCLSDEEVLELAKWGCMIEEHYTQKKGHWTPMDIEWAKDGELNKLFIVQARPETVQSQKKTNFLEEYRLKQKGKVLIEGKSVGSKIASGLAHVIRDVKDMAKFKAGEILVTEMTDPDWVVIMKQASAIITDKGGRTSHAAIVSRELGLPCVVGTNNATRTLATGQKITISCAEGDVGKVYEGLLRFGVEKTNLEHVERPKTKVMMNVGNPEEAFELSFLPNDGVGLAREEFIINSYIQIHPMALLKYDRLDEDVKIKIDALTKGYENKARFFVDKLAQGIAMISAAFYPKDVIVRVSDFKTNEYANLIGGAAFEPKEENPMIGWRGASRYYNAGYKEAFALECKALKKVRDEMGLKNVKVMIPMCRTVDEGRKVLKVMAENGLARGKNGLEVYVMCELPANVVLADQFSELFDGFSIGSNDLTQTTLGIDRDSALIADLFDERNEAVKRLVEYAITQVKEHKRKIGICGDAPSTYPEFAEFLVKCGIDSISLSPDAVLKTTIVINNAEKKYRR
ncbi:MAG: phosphoenolpyruvate synthase [Candidatus Aenigmarchaeota archaeon]|nr:phosphoenolpyruvate synthase [Candidatus Aenigmarchaeota archaeon]